MTDPTWASANLGVYLCLNCSGVHRSLGTHITQVRSITMDAWFPDQIEVKHSHRCETFAAKACAPPRTTARPPTQSPPRFRLLAHASPRCASRRCTDDEDSR